MREIAKEISKLELSLLKSRYVTAYLQDGYITPQQAIAYHIDQVTFDELQEEARRNYQNERLSSKA